MKNNQTVTNFDNDSDPFVSPVKPNYSQWSAFLVLETIFVVMGVYLLTSFIYFTIKK